MKPRLTTKTPRSGTMKSLPRVMALVGFCMLAASVMGLRADTPFTCAACVNATCDSIGSHPSGFPACGDCSWPGNMNALIICVPDDFEGCIREDQESGRCDNGVCSLSAVLICGTSIFQCTGSFIGCDS